MKEEELAKAAFSWFPGHMKSAWRLLEQQLKELDVLMFLLDARIPRSSQHPQLLASLSRRPPEQRPLAQIWVLNKCDLADPEQTKAWAQYLRAQGPHQVVEMQSQSGSGLGPLRQPLSQIQQAIDQRRSGRSLLQRPLRIMVVGLPNVGKSSLLNRLVGQARAKTGKKPGLTRGKSNWVSAAEGLQILDSPGILYPRIESWQQVAHLAACGNIRSEVLPRPEVAEILLQRLRNLGCQQRLPEAESLEALGRRLGFLLKGGQVDLERGAAWLLAQCFDGKIGPITWEPCHEKT